MGVFWGLRRPRGRITEHFVSALKRAVKRDRKMTPGSFPFRLRITGAVLWPHVLPGLYRIVFELVCYLACATARSNWDTLTRSREISLDRYGMRWAPSTLLSISVDNRSNLPGLPTIWAPNTRLMVGLCMHRRLRCRPVSLRAYFLPCEKLTRYRFNKTSARQDDSHSGERHWSLKVCRVYFR